MAAPPLVSVVIPYFNHGDCLRDAVISVESQTYGNLEIVVVDDGSLADGAAAVLGRRKSRPLRILRHAMFAGLGAARNSGAARASGEFLAFLEADDMIADSFVESAVAAFEDNPETEIVYTGVRTFGAFSEIQEPRVTIPGLLAGQDPPRTYLLIRTLHESISGYRNHMRVAENADYWLRLLLAGRQVLKLNEALSLCRVGEGTRSSRSDYSRRIVLELLEQHPDLYRANMESVLIEQKRKHLDYRDRSRALNAQTEHLRVALAEQHETLAIHYASALAAATHSGSEY